MKKILSLIFALSLITGVSMAQTEGAVRKISIGADFALPTGDLALSTNLGYGASIQGEYNLRPQLNVTASAGYLLMKYSQTYRDIWEPWGYEFKDSSVFPVKAGLKYYFKKNYYGTAEGGAAITSETGRATALALAAGAGASFAVSNHNAVELGLRYELWSMNGNSTFVGIRAAYSFGF